MCIMSLVDCINNHKFVRETLINYIGGIEILQSLVLIAVQPALSLWPSGLNKCYLYPNKFPSVIIQLILILYI